MDYRQKDMIFESVPALPTAARRVGLSWVRRPAMPGVEVAEEVLGVFEHEGRLYCRAARAFRLRGTGRPVVVPAGLYRVRLAGVQTPVVPCLVTMRGPSSI